MDSSVHKKLLKANFQLIALGVVSLLVALLTTWNLSKKANQLAEQRAPIAQQSTQLLAGTRQTMSSLRAWINKPDNEFKQRRYRTWRNEITPSMIYLESSAKQWGDYAVQNAVKLLKLRLADLEESQWWVEDIAQTPGNEPARVEFEMHGEVIADSIYKALATVRQIEENAGSAGFLPTAISYDLQSEFTHAHLLLARFVDQGNLSDESKLHQALRKFSSALEITQNLGVTLHEDLREVVERIQYEFTAYIPLVDTIIQLRKSPRWNHADFLMRTETMVISAELTHLIETLSAEQKNLMIADADEVVRIGHYSTGLMIPLIIGMLGIATLVARRHSRQITQPISVLSKAVADFSNGTLSKDVDVIGDDELAQLSDGFNQMRRTVQKHERVLEQTNANLEVLVAERTSELAIARELAETTLKSIGDAVLTTDEEGRIQSMNPVAESLMGWKFTEIHEQLVWDIFKVVNQTDQQPVECPVKRCLQQDKIVHLENNSNLIRRDGNPVPVSDSAAPIRSENGTIIGSVLVFKDVTEERRLSSELSYQASHDALTNLINRREFEQRVTSALRFARTEKRQHAIAFLDLDQFKVVNDTCGHAAGDKLLQDVSALLKKELRASDVLARLGGDEFALLLDTCPLDRAKDVCERMRDSVQSYRLVHQGESFGVSVSIGLSSIHSESTTVEEILNNADGACYIAKDKGRNYVHVNYPQDTDIAAKKSEMQWLSRINEALEFDRFVLYAQPIVPIKNIDGVRPHFEILIRMLDEQGEIIPPGAFIPAAERYNLIMAIDKWVVRHSFLALQEGNFSNILKSAEAGLSINLSGASLGNQEMESFIIEQMKINKVSGNRVSFEITETSAIADLTNATKFIIELQKYGFRFGLDDFGSGLSSFGYLRNLPVDYVKIDGSFVKEIDTNPIDAAVVSSIHNIAQTMGKKTVAEFVESEAILKQLGEIGVDFAQGWAIGKPSPLENADQHIKVLEKINCL
ncbi:MAG: EAL domain-containing protein [Methylococcaceae bacterium]